MANNSILLNLRSLFNIELAKRLLSVVIFVPVFIYSIYHGGVLLFSLFIFLCHVFVDVPWAMWQEARMSLRTFVPGPGTQYIGHTASYYVAN